jgi:hypothetical protein
VLIPEGRFHEFLEAGLGKARQLYVACRSWVLPSSAENGCPNWRWLIGRNSLAGAGRAPRTPTGVRIWYGRQPGVARYRSHTPGYHPRTPRRARGQAEAGRRLARWLAIARTPRVQEASGGWQEISPGGSLCSHTPACKEASPEGWREFSPGGAQATPGFFVQRQPHPGGVRGKFGSSSSAEQGNLGC